MARPRLLFAWELGANWGHAAKVLGPARRLAEAFEITVAARDPAAFRALSGETPLRVVRAPEAPLTPPRTAGDIGRSYPDDLRHCGWSDADGLTARLVAWRRLFAELRPDVLVAQAAPTALLAARGTGLPTALYGSGYDHPPAAEPMPPFQPELAGAAEAAVRGEARVLAVAEAALRRVGAPPLGAFAELLRGAAPILATFAQIDHYGPRARWQLDHAPYLGQIAPGDFGAALDWRAGAALRLLAYLRPGTPIFATAAEALASLPRDWDVVLAAPGIDAAAAGRLRAAGVRVVDGPVRLDRLLADCDLGVSHGSNGVAARFVLAGVPQLSLPTQVEQLMIARVLAEQRLGVAALGRGTAAELATLIRRAAAAPALRAAARAAATEAAAALPADPEGAVAEAIRTVAGR